MIPSLKRKHTHTHTRYSPSGCSWFPPSKAHQSNCHTFAPCPPPRQRHQHLPLSQCHRV